MKKELVSVIIPTYKRANMLNRAINSVLNQTYSEIEVIVVDDNAEGTEYRIYTEKFMKQYENNKRIKYIKHKINLGGSQARNTGVYNSNAEYIAFLDDDDEFVCTKIEKQIERLQCVNDSDYTAVYCNFHKIYNNVISKSSNCFGNAYEGDLSLDILLKKNQIAAGSSLLIRRNVFVELGGFDKPYKRHQDWEFMLRFFVKYRIALVDEYLLMIYTDDTSRRGNPEVLLETKEKFLKQFKYIIDKYEANLRKEIYKIHFLEVAEVCFLNGNIKTGMKYLGIANSNKQLTYKEIFITLIQILRSSRKYSWLFYLMHYIKKILVHRKIPFI